MHSSGARVHLTEVNLLTPLMHSPCVKMFIAKAIQAEGIPTARTLLVGVPGYLSGKTPGGIGIRKIVGGVLLITARSLDMLDKKGTKKGSERACCR